VSDILRWVADQYRKELYRVDAEACHLVDLVMIRAGQSWVCDDTIVDVDELLTIRQLAVRFGVQPYVIRDLIAKHGIPTRGKIDMGKAFLYRVGDVLKARG
jgi:hypothetical protein